MNTTRMSPLEIRRKGLEALTQALGCVGTVRFLQQFGSNKGDYTEEREKLQRRNHNGGYFGAGSIKSRKKAIRYLI